MEQWVAFGVTLSVIASAISAVLSWTAKVRWSEKERRAMAAQIAVVEAFAREAIKEKDTTIEALKQQNDTLKLFNYKEAREQLLAARQSFEELKIELTAELHEWQERSDQYAFQARCDRELSEKLIPKKKLKSRWSRRCSRP